MVYRLSPFKQINSVIVAANGFVNSSFEQHSIRPVTDVLAFTCIVGIIVTVLIYLSKGNLAYAGTIYKYFLKSFFVYHSSLS